MSPSVADFPKSQHERKGDVADEIGHLSLERFGGYSGSYLGNHLKPAVDDVDDLAG